MNFKILFSAEKFQYYTNKKQKKGKKKRNLQVALYKKKAPVKTANH